MFLFYAEGNIFRFILKKSKKRLDKRVVFWYNIKRADMAQLVERILGKDEVVSSILTISSKIRELCSRIFYFEAFYASKNTEEKKENKPT